MALPPTDSGWKVRVVGCGQCGAQIAATFSQKPSFLLSKVEHEYPIRCVFLDTYGGIVQTLVKDWSFFSEEDIRILPLAPPARVTDK